MKHFIAFMIALFLASIAYAINAERPVEKQPPTIEVFGFAPTGVILNDHKAFDFCLEISVFNIGYSSLIGNNKATEVKHQNRLLKKSGTARIQRLKANYLYLSERKDNNYKEVRIRGVDTPNKA